MREEFTLRKMACSNDWNIIEKHRDVECGCVSEHCYHRKTCDMGITSRNFKQRFCQVCRMDMYRDAREAKSEEFQRKKAAGGNQVMATGRVFFTSPLTYVHVDTCKVFTLRHENVEDAVAEWLKMAVPQLPALPAAPMVSTKGTSLDTGPVVDEAADFKERLAQDMKQLRKDIRQIYD